MNMESGKRGWRGRWPRHRHAAISKKAVRQRLVLAAICVVFVLAYSFLVIAAPPRPASPDESANLYFSRLFAKADRLYEYDYRNYFADGLIHPRSIRVVNEFLVPVGFIGLPILFGVLAKVTGLAVLPYFTPVLAVLAAIAWGFLIRRLFNPRVGLLSALLLLVCPVWWYWSARTFMPNVPFVALVIISAYFFFATPLKTRTRAGTRPPSWINGAIAGFFLGAALAIRMSEAYWLALAAAILLVLFRRSVPWVRLAALVAAATVVLTPVLFMNRALYGSYLTSGYAYGGSAVTVASVPQGFGNALLGPLRPYLFPLGFAPRTALWRFIVYGLGFHWWWSLLAFASLAFIGALSTRLLRRKVMLPRLWTAYGAVTVAVSVWLIFFYGSWEVQDNPLPGAVTIGSSYFRYWIPIFVLSTGPIAWAIVEVAKMVPLGRRRAFAGVILAAITAASAVQVFCSPDEGLLALRRNLIRYDREISEVVRLTEKDAIIVADRADKLIFPQRMVITPLRSEATYQALGKLKNHAPLYYYGITLPEKDVSYLRQEKLPPLGLGIKIIRTFQEETLYAFTTRQ